jgi:RNA recognition motif-containing protein
LSALKEVTVGSNKVHIGRYYHDYQIFVNRLHKDNTRAQVIEYFSQFGEVVDVVIT